MLDGTISVWTVIGGTEAAMNIDLSPNAFIEEFLYDSES